HLLPQKLPRDIFVGTNVIFFMSMNLIKLIPYGQLGLLRVGNVATILLLAPLAYLGVKIGVALNRRFNQVWFNRVIYLILTLTAVQLIAGQSIIHMIF
ncbi:MAG: sulfite exporter TauE/SafE family protein, partial [Desulfobacteraceae bacterium]|nr:sulfite exporter TauE/SafE family protein [Desulfobacteraceae bacterium]